LGFSVARVFRRTRHYPVDIFRFIAGVLNRRPDWVLLQGSLKFPLLDALVVRVLRLFGVSMAVTIHDVLPHYPSAWSRTVCGFYFRSFNRVVVHSKAALFAVRAMGVTVKVLTVPHGIYDIFKLTGVSQKEARKQIGQLTDKDFVILFFGNLEPRKGLIPFLDAAAALTKSNDIKFLLAGENCLNSHAPFYSAQLEAARSLPNVLVHDERIAFENVENYFSACDVVALPYLEGTTSGVLKLALAFEKPVVVTRVGDFPEQVPAGAGLFIDNNSAIVPALCEALLDVRAQPVKFTRAMAAAGLDAQWSDIAARLLSHLDSK
jgi:glycosyltransferase involved in cell wall biosynthesis